MACGKRIQLMIVSGSCGSPRGPVCPLSRDSWIVVQRRSTWSMPWHTQGPPCLFVTENGMYYDVWLLSCCQPHHATTDGAASAMPRASTLVRLWTPLRLCCSGIHPYYIPFHWDDDGRQNISSPGRMPRPRPREPQESLSCPWRTEHPILHRRWRRGSASTCKDSPGQVTHQLVTCYFQFLHIVICSTCSLAHNLSLLSVYQSFYIYIPSVHKYIRRLTFLFSISIARLILNYLKEVRSSLV